MKKHPARIAFLLACFLLAFAVACSDAANDNHDPDQAPAAADEAGHGDRIPNNGAAIEIVSPADGAVFNSGDSIVVEIAVTNFLLGENGNHWHILVDGASFGMITGIANDFILRGLEPGSHQIEVVLANGDHQDLQDGDIIAIEVR